MPRLHGSSGTHYAWLVEVVAKADTDECLLWPFATDDGGYGVVSYNWKNYRAHRMAFKIKYGKWPRPIGRHSCDNPPCFNPRHVLPGTTKQNVQDAIDRGRHMRGERSGLSVLTEEQVREIRSRYVYRKNGGMYKLAEEYGVTPGTIFFIISGRNWRHIL